MNDLAMTLRRSPAIARWWWCWVWALALVCLCPAAARADQLWSPAGAGEIAEALREVRLQRLRAGLRADEDTLAGLREGSALVVQRSLFCPVELKVINASGRAMWHVRVAVSGLKGGKQVEREMHLPFLPARSKAAVHFPCRLWSASGAATPVSAAAAVPGPTLGPDITREMLAAKEDHLALHNGFLVGEPGSEASIAALALDHLLEMNDRGLLREFLRQLQVEPAGAQLLGMKTFQPDHALLDGNKVVAAARDGKVDIVAAMELDRMLRLSCGGAAWSLHRCAKAIQECLRDGAGAMIAPRLLVDVDGELRRQLSSASVASAQELLAVLPALREVGLNTGPIAQHLCEQATMSPHAVEDLLALAAQVQSNASCIASSRSILFWRDVRSGAMLAGRFILAFLPVPLASLYLRRKWRRLRSRLGLDTEAPPAQRAAPEALILARLDTSRWANSFESGVTDLRRGLDADETEACRAASAAIGRAMACHGASIAELARGCAMDALRQGSLRSVLARLDGLLLYVLVVPSAHAEPKALVRYAALTDGWTAHARRLVEDSPALADAKVPVISLILFVRPDASEVALVAGYDDGQHRVWPGPVLAAGEARRAGGRIYPDHHEFNLKPA